MIYSLTHVAKPSPMIRGGYQQAVNVTDGECAATLTTRYESIGPTNILTLAHYPMTVVLYGNICGVKGIYPTITLSNNTSGVLLEYA